VLWLFLLEISGISGRAVFGFLSGFHNQTWLDLPNLDSVELLFFIGGRQILVFFFAARF
jgi:hypothetical protein